jgi:uncharacterized protein YdaU (DUF1376 family)
MSPEQSSAAGAGALPQSDALSEAAPASLAELMSRDPRGWTRQDRDRIISALRADRARRAEAEAKAAESGKKRSRTAVRMSDTTPPKSADEIGL